MGAIALPQPLQPQEPSQAVQPPAQPQPQPTSPSGPLTAGPRGNLHHVLEANRAFLAATSPGAAAPDKLPSRRMVIVTCMDTRLVGLLERAMGIGQGDAKVVKIAGAQVRHPFGSAMHSILIAVHCLQADEVFVVAHHDCGMTRVDRADFIRRMLDRGISAETIRLVERTGVDLDRFLAPFDNVYDSVRASVAMIADHPFLAEAGIPVHGLVIDPTTGRLELVVDGYATARAGTATAPDGTPNAHTI